jgi:hypothetical protein
MFGFDPFGIKRRRLAREAEIEAQRKRLRDRVAPASALQHSSSRSSSHAYSPMNDPLSPLNPLSPFSQVSQAESYSSHRHGPEPTRSHCSPSASDDSWSRSSSSGSDYGCSSSSYDSGSSSSYDSGSSSSSSDSSSSY